YFLYTSLKMKPWFHFEKEKQRNECSPLTLERKAIWSLLRRHAGAKNKFNRVSSLRTKFCEALFVKLRKRLLLTEQPLVI
ncbi:MAG: hypothetical protein IJA67_03880, partial [Oscillospiraceae bacterium]|nr:hypothetical protein [Oscillospiraceae bacterium]